MLGLNPTGALVWSLVEERDEDGLVQPLVERFATDERQAREDVRGFLSLLRERGLRGRSLVALAWTPSARLKQVALERAQPLAALLELTYACNWRCVFCYNPRHHDLRGLPSAAWLACSTICATSAP